MVYIEISDETYGTLRAFVEKLRPYASKFGNKVNDETALQEALLVADEMWSDKGYVKARLEVPTKEMRRDRKKFKENLR